MSHCSYVFVAFPSPVHRAFRGAVIGPPFTAGYRAPHPNWEAGSPAFSLFGFSNLLRLKPNSEKPRERGFLDIIAVRQPAVNGGPNTAAREAP